MAKMKLAFVGGGGIARYHYSHVEKWEDVEVVAVADVHEPTAKAFAERAGASKVYADYHDMYKDGGFDALFICVPPFAHEEQELLAAQLGIPFFVEKPPALTMELAHKVAAEVAKNKVITAVGFQDRYQDIIDDLKKYMDGRGVGLAYGSWIGGMPGVPWWRRKEMSGGQHVEQTIHIFDTARYLLGEVESVSAMASTGLMTHVENYNVEDASAVTMKFKRGTVATIFSACYVNGRGGKSGLELYFPDSRAEYSLRHAVKYFTKNEVREQIRGNDNGIDCDRAFIEAVKAKDQSKVRSPYADAVKSLQIVLAATESLAEGGKVVKLG